MDLKKKISITSDDAFSMMEITQKISNLVPGCKFHFSDESPAKTSEFNLDPEFRKFWDPFSNSVSIDKGILSVFKSVKNAFLDVTEKVFR